MKFGIQIHWSNPIGYSFHMRYVVAVNQPENLCTLAGLQFKPRACSNRARRTECKDNAIFCTVRCKVNHRVVYAHAYAYYNRKRRKPVYYPCPGGNRVRRRFFPRSSFLHFSSLLTKVWRHGVHIIQWCESSCIWLCRVVCFCPLELWRLNTWNVEVALVGSMILVVSIGRNRCL